MNSLSTSWFIYKCTTFCLLLISDHWLASDRRPATADLRPPTADPDRRAPSSDLWPPTADLWPPTSDLRLPTSDLRPLTSDRRPISSSQLNLPLCKELAGTQPNFHTVKFSFCFEISGKNLSANFMTFSQENFHSQPSHIKCKINGSSNMYLGTCSQKVISVKYFCNHNMILINTLLIVKRYCSIYLSHMWVGSTMRMLYCLTEMFV